MLGVTGEALFVEMGHGVWNGLGQKIVDLFFYLLCLDSGLLLVEVFIERVAVLFNKFVDFLDLSKVLLKGW